MSKLFTASSTSVTTPVTTSKISFHYNYYYSFSKHMDTTYVQEMQFFVHLMKELALPVCIHFSFN